MKQDSFDGKTHEGTVKNLPWSSHETASVNLRSIDSSVEKGSGQFRWNANLVSSESLNAADGGNKA